MTNGAETVCSYVTYVEPIEAGLYKQAAGEAVPPVNYREFDLTVAGQLEEAAQAFLIIRPGDPEFHSAKGFASKRTVETCRDTVKRAQDAGKVVIMLTRSSDNEGGLGDFWQKLRQLQASPAEV